MKTETLTWHELPADGMPDADITVMLEVLPPDGTDENDTETWPGWWSGERWLDAQNGWPIAAQRVVAWADMPAGSRGQV